MIRGPKKRIALRFAAKSLPAVIMASVQVSDDRILLDRLSYCRYGHPDLEKAKQFYIDFGLTPVAETGSKVYFRSFGIDPFCYVAEKTHDGKRRFLGGGWIVKSLAELEKAAKLPGSSQIQESDAPGGGKKVIVLDPVGMEITLHWGQQDRVPEPREVPKPVMWNTWEDKRRLGVFQRPETDAPSKVHKLGHYGFEVNIDKLHGVFEWYVKTFNLLKTDTLFHEESKKTVMIFIHLDKGKEYVDHHVRPNPLFVYVELKLCLKLTRGRISSLPVLRTLKKVSSKRITAAGRLTTWIAMLSDTTTCAGKAM